MHEQLQKLVRSVQSPEELWHIAEWRAATRRWQNKVVNMTLAEALARLREAGAITAAQTPEVRG